MPTPPTKRSPKISTTRLRIEAIFAAPDAHPEGYSVSELSELLDLHTRFVGNTIRSLMHNLTIKMDGKDDNGKPRYKQRACANDQLPTDAPIRNSNSDTGSSSYWTGYFNRMNTPRLTSGGPRG